MELLSIDKLVHASIFFILTGLLLIYLIKTRRADPLRITAVVLAAVTYGVLLEIMQAKYFSNRSSDWHDVIANSAGCFAALAFVGKIKRSSGSFPAI
jgi:VanZ family protein